VRGESWDDRKDWQDWQDPGSQYGLLGEDGPASNARG